MRSTLTILIDAMRSTLTILMDARSLLSIWVMPTRTATADDRNSCMTLHTKAVGTMVIWYISGHAGSSAVAMNSFKVYKPALGVREMRLGSSTKPSTCLHSS